MANYSELIATINDQIKANGNQEITGPVLNAVLQAIVKGLSKGSLFVGIATTATNPGTPDGNVFYLAIEPGTYSNFGVIVPNGSIGIISNTSSDWKVTLISRKISQELGNSEDAVVSQKAITKLLQTKTDNTLQTTDKTVAGAINEVNQVVKNKQDKTDESLQTTDKTVAGAINEVNQAVKTKQDKLKPGTGVEITSDNTVNVTLDTTVFKVVASLPESPAAGDENKIHLVPAESTEEGNIYTEYVFVNGKWEEFGTYRSEVDLAQYLKSTEAEATYQKITDGTLSTNAKTIVGAINELLSSGKVSGEVIAQALAELYAKVMGLGSVVDNMGHLRARRLTLDNFPEICGTPMYSSGEGAPSVPPEVPFQEYYDITNKKFYKAQGELSDTPTTANWIAIN